MKNLRKQITICCVSFLLSLAGTVQAQKTVELFNGKDLSNWKIVLEDNTPGEQVFFVKDGVINCVGKPFGYLCTKEVYSNFRLHVEWRWPKNEVANSGIFLLIQDPAKVWPNAIECQLHAGDAGDFVLLGGSNLKEFKLKKGEERPAFPVVKKKNPSNELKAGEWNNADITCKNGKIKVYINGTLQNKGSKPIYKSGYIALQSEGFNVQFRNVRLTPMK